MNPAKVCSRASLCLLVFLLAANLSPAQRRSNATRNRTIAGIVREIDARNIERTIRQLVSFGRPCVRSNRTAVAILEPRHRPEQT